MPKKVNKAKEVKSNSDVFEIYLGTFIDNAFTWYSIKKFKDLKSAYKEFKNYVNTQLKYTDEELQKVWDTGRLDIELRQGSRLLNWVGIYSRKVANLDEKEEKEARKGKIKKDSTDCMRINDDEPDSVKFNTMIETLPDYSEIPEEQRLKCPLVLYVYDTDNEVLTVEDCVDADYAGDILMHGKPKYKYLITCVYEDKEYIVGKKV